MSAEEYKKLIRRKGSEVYTPSRVRRSRKKAMCEALVLSCMICLSGCGDDSASAVDKVLQSQAADTSVTQTADAAASQKVIAAPEPMPGSAAVGDASAGGAATAPSKVQSDQEQASPDTSSQILADTPEPLHDPSETFLDLTQMSSTMIYAEVYQMMIAPEQYAGKTIRMEGAFTTFEVDGMDKQYFACIIQDATACCTQGIEFELAGSYRYPEDYPEMGDTIIVEGVFETYQEGELTYCHLTNAKIVE